MIELNVGGMTCNHCVTAVTQAIRGVDSKARINVDLVAHRVWVESAADVAAISNAVTDAGYDVLESRKM